MLEDNPQHTTCNNKNNKGETKMGTLEDKHCQNILKNENDEVNNILMN